MHESKEQRWRGWHEARVAAAARYTRKCWTLYRGGGRGQGARGCKSSKGRLRDTMVSAKGLRLTAVLLHGAVKPQWLDAFWLHVRVRVCMAETYAKWRLDTRIIEVHSTTLFACPQQKGFLPDLPCPQQKLTHVKFYMQTRFAQSRAGIGALPTELCPRSLHIFTSSSLAIRGYQGPVTPQHCSRPSPSHPPFMLAPPSQPNNTAQPAANLRKVSSSSTLCF